METNVFLTTAYEIETTTCRVPGIECSGAFILHPSSFTLRFAVEVEGDAPLIAVTEAFDA
jgi:hypothetical protein